MNDQELYRRARSRVLQLRGFYVHAAIYVCVNILLLLINLLTDPFSLWFYWPLLGWGIGLAVHAFVVFGAGGALGKDWEERKAVLWCWEMRGLFAGGFEEKVLPFLLHLLCHIPLVQEHAVSPENVAPLEWGRCPGNELRSAAPLFTEIPRLR